MADEGEKDTRAEGLPEIKSLDELFDKPKIKVVGLDKKRAYKGTLSALQARKKREKRKNDPSYGKRTHAISRIRPFRSRGGEEKETLIYSGLLVGALGAMALLILKNR